MATTSPPPTRPPVFNLPNQLTASRFGLAIILFVLIEFEAWLACLFVFALASLTDWLDGYLARKLNLGSTLGRNLDPLVDKVLVCGAYIFLLPPGEKEGWLHAWMVTVVVARELVITGLRSFLETQGAKFGADWLGKVKMVLQCAALIAIFLAKSSDADWLPPTRDALIYAMLVFTVLSGLQYLWRAAALLRSDVALS